MILKLGEKKKDFMKRVEEEKKYQIKRIEEQKYKIKGGEEKKNYKDEISQKSFQNGAIQFVGRM